MKIDIAPGRYVLAVSGGVDSMVLLDLLAGQAGLELIVAHFDHGIRSDSDEDRQLVQVMAEKYGLPFVSAQGKLGANASEATARTARYTFLHAVAVEQGAQAIVTAHHQDDVLETAIINLLSGTGNRGLSSLRSANGLVRPLLDIPKKELTAYAIAHNLQWREDSTNQDERYLRNYIRSRALPRLSAEERTALLQHVQISRDLHERIEELAAPWISGTELDRATFVHFPHMVACEIMASWLRHHQVQFDRPTIERLVVFAKTSSPGKYADVQDGHRLHSTKSAIILEHKKP